MNIPDMSKVRIQMQIYLFIFIRVAKLEINSLNNYVVIVQLECNIKR